MIIVHNRIRHNFDDPKKLFKFLSNLKNDTVEVRNPSLYDIDGLILDDDGLQFLANIIDDCNGCEKSECGCPQPYFLIKEYLQIKCEDSDCLECNPFKCDIFKNNYKINKVPKITKDENEILNSILIKVYTELRLSSKGEHI